MTMLKGILDSAVLAAKQKAEREDLRAKAIAEVVAKLHAIYDENLPELNKLVIRTGYGDKPFSDIQDNGWPNPGKSKDGFVLGLGSAWSGNGYRLIVVKVEVPDADTNLLRGFIRVYHDNGRKHEELGTFGCSAVDSAAWAAFSHLTVFVVLPTEESK